MHGIVKKNQVQLEGVAFVATGKLGVRPTSRCKKSVRAVRVENVVRAFEVTCSCGETTVVEMQYQEAKT